MPNRNVSTWCLLVALAGLLPRLHAADLPAFNNVRFEENATAYRDVESVGPLGSIKFIPFGDSDSVFLSLGGQVRARWEYWNNFNFDEANDDDFGLLRLRLHGDLHAGDHVRVFVEGKSATATDRDLPGGRRTLDVDELDVQNAFVDLIAPAGEWTGTLRLGRQELSYGAQRLISPLDWSNTRRTWDGGRIILKNNTWRIDSFATQYVPVDKYDFNEPDSDQKFYGVYAVHDITDLKLKVDLYALRLDREHASTGSPAEDDDRYTAGLRLSGTCPLTGVEYDVEGGWQFGDAGERDIEAWFAAAELGYTLADVAMKPRVYLGYDYASGDDNPGDDKAKTFNQLYPLVHAFLGYIDVVGRQNIEDVSFGASLWPVAKKIQAKADYHLFNRAETEDALYNAGGAIVRKGSDGESKDVGSEIDLTVTYKISRETTAWAGYSHFFAGDFIEESGPDEDINFAYASIQYTF
jgi:Alginate export